MSPSEPPIDAAATLRGPIIVLGAGGFVGANLFRRILTTRSDVFAVVRSLPAWRLSDIPPDHVLVADVTGREDMSALLGSLRPATVFNCVSYGAYSFETEPDRIYRTNFEALMMLVKLLQSSPATVIINAGSSSEYGLNCAGPDETGVLIPNSDYAVAKAAAANFISFAGKVLAVPVANLRLYSVFGPYEDTSRLVPNLIIHGARKAYPPFVNPDISRDFVYVDDVNEAFLRAATRLTPKLYGESFNIGCGTRITIRQVAETAQKVFGIGHPATFGGHANRAWDLIDWYANPAKARRLLGWTADISFEQGLRHSADWFSAHGVDKFDNMTKRLA